MIRQIVDREEFDRCLEMLENGLLNRLADLENGNRDAATTAEVHRVSPADLRDAHAAVREIRRQGLPPANASDAAWMPRDPVTSILQSAIEQFYEDAGAVDETKAVGLIGGDVAITDRTLREAWLPRDSEGFAKEFESTDPRWAVSFLAAKALKSGRGQRSFPSVTPPAVQMANRARVLLVGDWGSGVQRAQKVAACMTRELEAAPDRERYVVHLGDVYYSGFEKEYQRRFLPFWPVTEPNNGAIGSFCLNANHDMFTGGHAYFDFLLRHPLFARQGGSSYFSMENEHWQILGLDTGYDPKDFRGSEGTLFGPQASWVQEKRTVSPGKKAVLLSHHPLFSAYESGSPELERKLQPVLSTPNGITAWFWAHEHRCVVYDQNHPVKHARTVGYGGIPVYAAKEATPPGVTHEFRESFKEGLESFARFGFASLDFQEDAISVRYISEDGITHFSEVIR
jgi:hypothetical protein